MNFLKKEFSTHHGNIEMFLTKTCKIKNGLVMLIMNNSNSTYMVSIFTFFSIIYLYLKVL